MVYIVVAKIERFEGRHHAASTTRNTLGSARDQVF